MCKISLSQNTGLLLLLQLTWMIIVFVFRKPRRHVIAPIRNKKICLTAAQDRKCLTHTSHTQHEHEPNLCAQHLQLICGFCCETVSVQHTVHFQDPGNRFIL